MDEDRITTVDTTTETAAETGDGFLEGWEEDTTFPGTGESAAAEDPAGDQGGTEDAAEDPAGDQGGPEEEGAAEQATGTDQAGGQQEPPQTWTLTHLGQQIAANEADMVILAQKGLDYDRIRSEYDAAKPVMALFKNFAGRADMNVPEYLAHIRTQAKQVEGLSEAEAKRAVDLEDREAVVAQREEQEQARREAAAREMSRRQAEETRRQADIGEFMRVFPEAAQNPQSIPQEVWDAVRSGYSLVAAYAVYRQNQAMAEAERAEAVAQQNRQNEERSSGSMRSSGTNGRKDPFLEGWDDD